MYSKVSKRVKSDFFSQKSSSVERFGALHIQTGQSCLPRNHNHQIPLTANISWSENQQINQTKHNKMNLIDIFIAKLVCFERRQVTFWQFSYISKFKWLIRVFDFCLNHFGAIKSIKRQVSRIKDQYSCRFFLFFGTKIARTQSFSPIQPQTNAINRYYNNCFFFSLSCNILLLDIYLTLIP